MKRKTMAENPAERPEVTCLRPVYAMGEQWVKITTHEVAIMVTIKKEHMRKYGVYLETNQIEEDMVGWVTIWKKMEENATNIEDMWRGKEILVFLDPGQENENILDFYTRKRHWVKMQPPAPWRRR